MTDYKGKACRYCTSQGIGFEIESFKAILGRVIDRIEYQIMYRPQINSLSGEELFNRVIGISEKSNNLIVIGGWPYSKHLAVAENILFGELEAGTLSAIVGSETGNQNVLRRYLAKMSEVDASLIAFGTLSDNEWIQIDKAINQMAKRSNIFAISCKTMTVHSLTIALEKLKLQQPNLGFALVSADDFIHSFKSACYSDNHMCPGGALRYLADKLNISIVVTTGLCDQMGSPSDHQATMKGLPKHLNLVDYADFVVLCEYPDTYEEDPSKHNNLIKVFVSSNRGLTRINIPINEAMMPEINQTHLA